MPVRGRDRRVSTLLTGVTVSPKQVLVGKSERIVVTFSERDKVPEASLFLVFTSGISGLPQIVRTEKVDDHSIAAIAPVNSSEESVKIEVLYIEQETTFVLFRDRLAYVKSLEEPCSSSQPTDGMGASITTNKGSIDLRESPQLTPSSDIPVHHAINLLRTHLLREHVNPLTPNSLSELCGSLKKLPPGNLVEVDSVVGGDMERDSVPMTVCVGDGAPEDGQERADGTLFHLLAQFGLKKIAQQILSLPEAKEGAVQLDHKGCLPEKVAEREGHNELSKLFVSCRRALSGPERESRSCSTSSLETEWSTITVRTRKKTNQRLVRVASYTKGQLVKVALEQNEFSSLRTELGSGSDSDLIEDGLGSKDEEQDDLISDQRKMDEFADVANGDNQQREQKELDVLNVVEVANNTCSPSPGVQPSQQGHVSGDVSGSEKIVMSPEELAFVSEFVGSILEKALTQIINEENPAITSSPTGDNSIIDVDICEDNPVITPVTRDNLSVNEVQGDTPILEDTIDEAICDEVPSMVRVKIEETAKESSDELHSVDSLTEVTCSAPDLLSDNDRTTTPTIGEDLVPPEDYPRSQSITTPELVPLRTAASKLRLGMTRESWRRSKSLNAVDLDEEPIWEESVENPTQEYPTSESCLSSDEEDSESAGGEESPRHESDTDSFLSAREDFNNSPSLPRSKVATNKSSDPVLLKVSEVVKKAVTRPLGELPSVSIVEVTDKNHLVNGEDKGSVPQKEPSFADVTAPEKSVGFTIPKGEFPRTVSTESDMARLSDLNLSDVDVSINSEGLDESIGRDRGKSDPLPFSIVVAHGEMESSHSHETLSSPKSGPTLKVINVDDGPEESVSSKSVESPKQHKKRSGRSKTHLGVGGQTGCDSGFESNNSRNASSVSDTMSVVLNTLTTVKRSQSARSDSAVADKVRSSFILQPGSPPIHRHSTEELRDNNTLPPSPLVSVSPKDRSSPPVARSPTHSRDKPAMTFGSPVEDGDEVDEPKMYQTSVEEVVLRRKLSNSPVMRKTLSDSRVPLISEEKQAKVLVSPSKSKSRRATSGGDSPTTPPHNLMNSISSNSIQRNTSNSECVSSVDNPDGGSRRGSVRSMLIQPSSSMFSVGSASLMPTTASDDLPPPPQQVKLREKNKSVVDKTVRASIAVEYASQFVPSVGGNQLYSQDSFQSVPYWNEDQASVTELTIAEEQESESSNPEQEDEDEKRPLSSHPELVLPQQFNWSQTVSKKRLKAMSRAERDRQSLMFEFIQTEQNHHQSLALMALVFRNGMLEKSILSEDQVHKLFPVLDDLLSISKRFSEDLRQRKEDSPDSILETISDVLLQQFVGWRADQMVKAFGTYASNQKYIVSSYKEHMKLKKFKRFVNECCKNPAANRRNFPDLVQSITARISKYVILMENLVKESERCAAADVEDLYTAKSAIQRLVQEVECVVKEKTSRIELVRIQDSLDVHLPKSVMKDEKKRKDLKSIQFTASHRRLIRDGRAIWLGSHQRALEVYVVLVTDFIAFLSETNGKYNIALLQDFQPPVIRLVDIHVRVDAASKVQLLILKKEQPEFYKLKFKNSVECDRWQAAISSAIEVCKEKKFNCDCFGGKPDPEQKEVEDHAMEPKEKMISDAHRQVTVAQKLLERSKPTVSVFRSGSFAAADRQGKSLLQRENPRMSSQRGLGGPRNRPERKSAMQKTKEALPQEYIAALVNMTDTVQKLLECITEQDITIAKLNDQLQRQSVGTAGNGTIKRQTSSASVTSESNLDWGTRTAVPMTTVNEGDDSEFSESCPVVTMRTHSISSKLYNRPRSFHEELTRSYDTNS